MKAFFVTTAFALFSLAAKEANAQAMPQPIFPTEDFEYACEVQLGEQVGADFSAAKMNFRIQPSEFDHGHYTFTTPANGWTPEYGNKLPARLVGHHIYMHFGFGDRMNGKVDRVSLSGRIFSGQLNSSARSKGRFLVGQTIQSDNDLIDLTEKLVLSFNVSCTRTK